jgi:peptidyl-prolyl cis-trans isomerase C
MRHVLIVSFCLLLVSLAFQAGIAAEGGAASEVAVTVNGVDVTEAEVAEAMKGPLERLKSRSGDVPEQFIQQYTEKLRRQTVDGLIVQRLLDQQVKTSGIEVSDEDVDRQINEMAARQKPPISPEQFRQLLKAYGRDIEQVRRRIRQGMAYEKLIERRFADRLQVGDSQISDYYQQNRGLFEEPEQVEASHILIKPEEPKEGGEGGEGGEGAEAADPNDAKAAARRKAEQLLEAVRSGGDFAALARDNSDCPSSAKGGQLGFGTKSDPESGRQGSWVEPFEKAAFALEVGQVSDVVETRFGYHIIKVTDRKAARVQPLEEARGRILEALTESQKGRLAREYVESLKESAKIVYPPGKEPQPLAPKADSAGPDNDSAPK